MIRKVEKGLLQGLVPCQFLTRAVPENLTLVQDHHLIFGRYFIGQMGRPENGHAMGFTQIVSVFRDRPSRGGIKADRRFVQQQNGRGMHQGSRDFQPPAMTAIEVAYTLMGALCHIKSVQRGSDRCFSGLT